MVLSNEPPSEMAEDKRPLGLLFDIGGVCVVSPFQAILDYEIANNIPLGWINFNISRKSPDGSWHKLERGEINLDADFFAGFNRDFRDPAVWKQYVKEYQRKEVTTVPGKSPIFTPHPPEVDAEFLFWEMMRMSRTADPYMFPALIKLKDSGKFILGALSNTTKFPDGHPYNRDISGVKSQFDFFISSAHVGLRKPDPRIYEVALQEMNRLAKKKEVTGVLSPSDIVFLDDIGQNLRAAKQVGMRTIKVNLGKTQDAVKELEKITGFALLADHTKSKL